MYAYYKNFEKHETCIEGNISFFEILTFKLCYFVAFTSKTLRVYFFAILTQLSTFNMIIVNNAYVTAFGKCLFDFVQFGLGVAWRN